jgi:hypothetical protein
MPRVLGPLESVTDLASRTGLGVASHQLAVSARTMCMALANRTSTQLALFGAGLRLEEINETRETIQRTQLGYCGAEGVIATKTDML